VGDLLELAPKQSTRVDWERKKIRVVGRIGNWPGNSGFMLLDYERRSRHPGWDIHALGNFVPVVIDRSSADEPADEEFQAPVEWGRRVEVTGFVSFRPSLDNPAKITPALTIKPSVTSPMTELVKAAESSRDH
jgi:hypothetical protein